MLRFQLVLFSLKLRQMVSTASVYKQRIALSLDRCAKYILRIFAIVSTAATIGCTDNHEDATWEIAAQGLYAGAFSANANLALVGSLNHGASLWRMQDKERLFNWSHSSGEFAQLVAASFSPDASRAVTTDPRTMVMWNTQTGTALQYWATPGAVLDVAVLHDNQRVLLGLKDHSALLFDAVTGSYQATFLHAGAVGTVAVSNDGEYALTGSDDETAVLWSIATGKKVHTFTHGNPIREVAISPSSKYSLTAAQGDIVAIWDNQSGKMLHQLHRGLYHGVASASFSADDSLLVLGYTNRQVALFDVQRGTELRTWDSGTKHAMRATGAAVIDVAFATDQAVIYALVGDGRLLAFSFT